MITDMELFARFSTIVIFLYKQVVDEVALSFDWLQGIGCEQARGNDLRTRLIS